MFKDISLLEDPTKQVLQLLYLSMGNLFSTKLDSQYFNYYGGITPRSLSHSNCILQSRYFVITFQLNTGICLRITLRGTVVHLPVQLWENHLLQNTKEDQTMFLTLIFFFVMQIYKLDFVKD